MSKQSFDSSNTMAFLLLPAADVTGGLHVLACRIGSWTGKSGFFALCGVADGRTGVFFFFFSSSADGTVVLFSVSAAGTVVRLFSLTLPADGTDVLFSISAGGTVVLFFFFTGLVDGADVFVAAAGALGGRCASSIGGSGDGPWPPGGTGAASQGGVAVFLSAIVFIPSSSSAATSFCLPSGTTQTSCL